MPVWVAGRWPNRRPFRRAARWDGVFPVFEGVGWGEMPTPETLAEAVDYTREQRPEGAGPFDVALESSSRARTARPTPPWRRTTSARG